MGRSLRGRLGRFMAVAGSCLAPAACMTGGGAEPPAPIGPPALMVVRVDPPLTGPRIEPPVVVPVEANVRYDEILASPMLAEPSFQDAVSEWVQYWRGAAAGAVPNFLGRMGVFGAAVDSALEAAALPPSLRYLPFIESGYNPAAASSASAVGMWQFMSGTGRELGLEVGTLVDQRRDPELSTAAAMSFLTELRQDFGSWFLALAAYNSGPNRVRRILREEAPDGVRSDSVFWAVRDRFPRETRDFVPKLIGAVLVASHPHLHGFEPAAAEPFAFDLVEVPDATSLDVVAAAAGVSQADIERLNPSFVRNLTPRGRATTLRVPEGTGALFTTRYAEIPPEERVTFVEHRVAEGETLSHIAVRYGVRVDDIHAANPGLRPRYLRIGTLLTVPVAPSLRGTGS